MLNGGCILYGYAPYGRAIPTSHLGTATTPSMLFQTGSVANFFALRRFSVR